MAKGCEWADGCDLPDVPVYSLTKIDSDEIDGYFCRVHAQRRASQRGRERRAERAKHERAQGIVTAGMAYLDVLDGDIEGSTVIARLRNSIAWADSTDAALTTLIDALIAYREASA